MKSVIFLLVVLVIFADVSGDRVDISALQRCANLAESEVFCSNSKYTSIRDATLDAAIACNSARKAIEIAGECAMDTSNGLYCGAAHFYVPDITTALDACTPVSENCSDECRDSLVALRNDLGCCINTIYNHSDSTYVFYRPVFTYSLWSNCGVEPALAGGCPGGKDYTFSPERTCSYSELETEVLSLFCNQTSLSDFKNAFGRESECESYYLYFMDLCSVDADNNFCLANNIAEDIATYISPIVHTCDTDCTPTCESNLQKLVMERDCCVHALHNSTLGEVVQLNNYFDINLLDYCDVVNPGTCDLFTPGPGPDKGSGRMLTSFGTVVVTLLFLTLVA